MTPRWPNRGDAAPAALWAAGIMTGIAFLMAGIIGSGRAYMRERALVDEANNLINAVRAYQADEAAPLSEYNNAAEVAWPDGAGPDGMANDPIVVPPVVSTDDCSRALALLAGDTDFNGIPGPGPNYVSTRYAASSQSIVFPSLRWVASCDGEQFRLQLSSFGDAEICTADTTGQSTGECPPVTVARTLAGATGGALLPENTGVLGAGGPGEDFDAPVPPSPTGRNSYVDWTVWRGAAYPALNRLAEQLVWKNYNPAVDDFGIDQPTTAFSGIRLGGWEDPLNTGDFFDSGTPPELARFIFGADGSVRANNLNPRDTLLVPDSTYTDGRSFAMFYRAWQHDPFELPTTPGTPLFQLPRPLCPPNDPITGLATSDPTWIASVESIRLAFSGFANTSAATITLAPSAVDEVTLIPIAWQVYDNGTALQYNPEVIVELMTVLPGFLNTATTPTSYCLPHVIHGRLDTRDTSTTIEVFLPADEVPGPGVQVYRTCNYTDGTGPIAPPFPPQTVPAIPRAQIADFRVANLMPPPLVLETPAIRVSGVGYCHMPGAPGDVRP